MTSSRATKSRMTSKRADLPQLTGRPGVMTSRLNAAGMTMEALAVFFGTLASVGTSGAAGRSWIVGLALTVWCLVVVGLSRSPIGVAVAAVTQLVVIAVSTQVDLGIIVSIIFAALWGWLVWVGLKVDRDRAAVRAGEDPPVAPGHTG